MCVGVPMQIVEIHGLRAWCLNGDERNEVDLSLVGEQAIDTWVLVFLGHAREVLDEEQALQIRRALLAVEAAMQGELIADAFADLDREPQLPDFLRRH